ncbi:MAG: hypothetical protein ABSC51_08105 [Gaiellaceae bacterium]|jgi:hypothetical protein
MRLLVKVRVDLQKIAEFGRKLQQKELDNSSIRFTYCLKDDPSAGLAIWEVEDSEEFKSKFDPWRPFYSDVEVAEVVTPAEARRLLSQGTG